MVDDLDSITIPSGVVGIGRRAFYKSDSLKEVNFSEGLISIEEGAFFGCKSLEMLKFPKSLRFLSKDSFTLCKSLTSVDISLGNEDLLIDDNAFYDCAKLEKVKILGKNVRICHRVFGECPELRTVILSNGTRFDDDAFEGCNKDLEIKMVDLEKGLKD